MSFGKRGYSASITVTTQVFTWKETKAAHDAKATCGLTTHRCAKRLRAVFN